MGGNIFQNRNIGRVATTSKAAHREAEPILLSKFNLYNEINNYYENKTAIIRLEEKIAKLKVGGDAYKRDTKRVALLNSMVERFPERLAIALQYPSVRAQVNREHEGETPMYRAIRGYNPDIPIARLLLDAGGDPNTITPNDAGSLLHYAVGILMNIDVVNLLVEYGADINTIFKSKYSGFKTPLDTLTDMGDYSSREELEARGVFDFMEELRELGAKTYTELTGLPRRHSSE